jgi:NitT/TauT family transport system substrate-binding protein
MQRRKFSRRGLLKQAVGIATATLLPMPAIAQARPVKFTLSWLATGSFAFVYAAQAKEFMKKRGIDMSIARGFGSFAAAQSIAAGAFDCGLSAVPAVALSVAKGLPLISLATTDYDAMMGIGVLADSPIKKPQDLAGKKIASVPTSGESPSSRLLRKGSGSISALLNRCMSTTRCSSACSRKSRWMRSLISPPPVMPRCW